VLLVDAGPTGYSSYRITVTRPQSAEPGAPVWQRTDVTRGYQDLLALALPAGRLEAGAYRLRVEGRREDGSADRAYDFVTELDFEFEPHR
jgi:hypothetical protein